MMEISGSGGAGNAALLQQWRERLFSRADKDADGKLSLEEVRSLRPAEPAGGGEGSPAGSAGDPANTAPSEAAGFTTGTLARATVEQVFGLLDTDGDGSVTATERVPGEPPPAPSIDGPPAVLVGTLSDRMLSVLFGAQAAAEASGGTTSEAESGMEVANRLAAMLELALKAYQPAQSGSGTAETA